MTDPTPEPTPDPEPTNPAGTVQDETFVVVAMRTTDAGVAPPPPQPQPAA